MTMPPTATKFRKLKPTEIFYEVAQGQFEFMITCYWLVLESQKDVSEEQIRESLRILFRNIDVLHLIIRKENDDFWFYKMNEESIPLKVLRNQSPDDILHKEMHTSIDSSAGPLWRANYIINDKTNEKNDTFTRDILFTFNHAISDGFTAFHICNRFLKVLNDVIDGKLQESYCFGQLCEGQETDELMLQRMEYLHKNPEYHNELQNLLADMEKQKIRFSEFFPVPSGTPKMTKHIYREIDEETNKKMLKVFKSKKLSLHSGFSAVANWALMELFTENGLTDEQIDLTTFHMINLRRYWKKTSEIQLGPHVTPIRIVSPTDRNVGANLWQYAREFNVMLKNEIESKRGLDFTVVRLMPKPEGPNVNDFSMMINSPSVSYYSTTNMGDLSSMLQGRGDHVSIKWLARCTSAHTINTLMTHIFQTYEGKFLYGLGYSTHIVRDDAANLYVDKIINKLKIISNLQ
ncbi:hypothetical protein Anas_05266 [Armadillidium nasatum]|uniref:Condensation domain-containing protein n=1 Tax=Armadillidium nasatum TaxID=96803 RepID=A0A5N5TI53_9CRUS|nr:hypothetical protein Anas_05266 [Armadillidium nasatum]